MPKRGVGQQGTVSRPDAHVLCSGDALSSIVWRVVTAGTLDTIEVIEQSVVCAAECSVPSVAAPMCCHWELLSGSPGPGTCGVIGVLAPGVRGFLLPFRVLRCLKNSHARPADERRRLTARHVQRVASFLSRYRRSCAWRTRGIVRSPGPVPWAWPVPQTCFAALRRAPRAP